MHRVEENETKEAGAGFERRLPLFKIFYGKCIGIDSAFSSWIDWKIRNPCKYGLMKLWHIQRCAGKNPYFIASLLERY